MTDSSADAGSQAALDFLWGRIDYERTAAIPYDRRAFQLDRMRRLLEAVGNPDAGLKIIHVAGTKGKGSTAAMLGAALTAAGYRTGLYSSPHLDYIGERIAIDGLPCPLADLAALLEELRPVVDRFEAQGAAARPRSIGPTFFEILTAAALLRFARERADFAVLEVGLGGRLDSTNVCQPLTSVITSISFDHTKQLGTTLAAIAGEKAGIIKPGVPVVSGVLNGEARAVIERVAGEHGCRLWQLERDFFASYRPPHDADRAASCGLADIAGAGPRGAWQLERVPLRLLGRHQSRNAAVAIATLEVLRGQGWSIGDDAVRRGLAEVSWPARVEVVSRAPTVIVDAAHNTASIASLLETLAESFRPSRRKLIFATTLDKDIRGMLHLLLPRFDDVILTQYHNNPRGVPLEKLIEIAESVRRETGSATPVLRSAPEPRAAWQACQASEPADLICIAGSFFLAAELRPLIAAVVSPPAGSPLELGSLTG